MFTILLVCTIGYKAGAVCNPPQPMPSRQVCQFLARNIEATGDRVRVYVATSCVTINKPLKP